MRRILVLLIVHFRLALVGTAAAIYYKIQLLNDLSLTVAEDPLDLWVALGVLLLLLDASVRPLGLPTVGARDDP